MKVSTRNIHILKGKLFVRREGGGEWINLELTGG
jgi:hypothetical protein